MNEEREREREKTKDETTRGGEYARAKSGKEKKKV